MNFINTNNTNFELNLTQPLKMLFNANVDNNMLKRFACIFCLLIYYVITNKSTITIINDYFYQLLQTMKINSDIYVFITNIVNAIFDQIIEYDDQCINISLFKNIYNCTEMNKNIETIIETNTEKYGIFNIHNDLLITLYKNICIIFSMFLYNQYTTSITFDSKEEYKDIKNIIEIIYTGNNANQCISKVKKLFNTLMIKIITNTSINIYIKSIKHGKNILFNIAYDDQNKSSKNIQYSDIDIYNVNNSNIDFLSQDSQIIYTNTLNQYCVNCYECNSCNCCYNCQICSMCSYCVSTRNSVMSSFIKNSKLISHCSYISNSVLLHYCNHILLCVNCSRVNYAINCYNIRDSMFVSNIEDIKHAKGIVNNSISEYSYYNNNVAYDISDNGISLRYYDNENNLLHNSATKTDIREADKLDEKYLDKSHVNHKKYVVKYFDVLKN